jgi:hypothetical protein
MALFEICKFMGVNKVRTIAEVCKTKEWQSC